MENGNEDDEFEGEDEEGYEEEDFFMVESSSSEESGISSQLFNVEISENCGRTTVEFYSTALPINKAFLLGFHTVERFLEVSLSSQRFDYNHTTQKKRFIGEIQVEGILKKFLENRYEPRNHYNSAKFVIKPKNNAEVSISDVNELDRNFMLFESNMCDKSLSPAYNFLKLTHGNIEDAKKLIQTGESSFDTPVPFKFEEQRIPYLIMEILDTFLDIQKFCYMCGRALSVPVVKPSTCDDDLCRRRLTELGVGTSAVNELRNQPEFSDFILSIYAVSCDSEKGKSFGPQPPVDGWNHKEKTEMFRSLPRVRELGLMKSDEELENIIGRKRFHVLRWLLFSVSSQYFYLSPEISAFREPGLQFLAYTSNYEKEIKFAKLKEKYGSLFLWHGTHPNRLHSIIRDGLKIGKREDGTLINGDCLGTGMYFSFKKSTSINYSQVYDNVYKNSSIRQIQVLLLCEIAKTPELKSHDWAHTTTNEDAVILRYIFVNPHIDERELKEGTVPSIPHIDDVIMYTIKKQKSGR